MTPDTMFPPIVFTLWHATVVVALVVLVPLSVYWLHSLWRTASSIRKYTRESLIAARAIEANTAAVPALHDTIAVAGELLAAAESVATKLDAIAGALEARARTS